jgi:hypothetical protein
MEKPIRQMSDAEVEAALAKRRGQLIIQSNDIEIWNRWHAQTGYKERMAWNDFTHSYTREEQRDDPLGLWGPPTLASKE